MSRRDARLGSARPGAFGVGVGFGVFNAEDSSYTSLLTEVDALIPIGSMMLEGRFRGAYGAYTEGTGYRAEQGDGFDFGAPYLGAYYRLDRENFHLEIGGGLAFGFLEGERNVGGALAVMTNGGWDFDHWSGAALGVTLPHLYLEKSAGHMFFSVEADVHFLLGSDTLLGFQVSPTIGARFRNGSRLGLRARVVYSGGSIFSFEPFGRVVVVKSGDRRVFIEGRFSINVGDALGTSFQNSLFGARLVAGVQL